MLFYWQLINRQGSKNKFDYYTASGNIVSDLTDHFSQFCILKSTTETTKPWKMAARDYSKFFQQMFLQELSELTWESLPSAEDPSKFFSTFYNKLNKLVNWSMHHSELYKGVKVNSWKNLGSLRQFEKQ